MTNILSLFSLIGAAFLTPVRLLAVSLQSVSVITAQSLFRLADQLAFGFFGVVMDMNLVILARTYDSDAKCRQYLEELAWPDGVKCPRCQSDKISRIEKAQSIRL